MKEVFKDIPNYEGIYKISNLGNIISLKFNKTLNFKLGVKSNTNNSYLNVNLRLNNKKRCYGVHQLVAMAFLNHKVSGHKLVINHIDFNKRNNNLNNLEIVTSRENSNLKHIKSSSKYVGVSWCNTRKKWCSNIRIKGNLINLGRFNNELDASNAYQKKLFDIKSLVIK
tara:strand:+ start:152 stop:658 length:507 start_codon:yes stop_codon:yes gene_type:complete